MGKTNKTPARWYAFLDVRRLIGIITAGVVTAIGVLLCGENVVQHIGEVSGVWYSQEGMLFLTGAFYGAYCLIEVGWALYCFREHMNGHTDRKRSMPPGWLHISFGFFWGVILFIIWTRLPQPW